MTMKTIEIAPGITWVGVEDFQRRMFDALIPLPHGTSFNAYLVKGKQKTALIDTVHRSFEQELFGRIAAVTSVDSIDYLVMNHAEPDHGSSIPLVLAAAPKAMLVTTKKGAEMAEVFYRVPESRRLVVKEGDTLDLGGKTLRFIDAPWLHWPETMFTFAVEDRVLFSCDFFGSHIASDRLLADEVGDIVIPEARRYYAEIMMPFVNMVASGIDKTVAANPRIIAPSHGPVHANPARIIAAYQQWARGPLANKAIVPYVSMWGSTERLAQTVTSAISAEGVEAVPYDLMVADVSHIASDLIDASAVVLGSPTVLGGLHPVATNALTLVKALRPRVKLAAFFGSYGWGGGAAAQAKAVLEGARFEVAAALEVKGPPGDKDLADAVDLGRKVARRVKENVSPGSGAA
ncbi:MAG: FprA family A-type flavoprotein [Dehalococcoidia bacterium]|nr:FprA family A-type flavoprotein [Dehalococcoidia bacterium]